MPSDTKTDHLSATAVAMIKNEADIIALFASHLLALFDNIIIVDHQSEDGTAEFLQDLRAGVALTQQDGGASGLEGGRFVDASQVSGVDCGGYPEVDLTDGWTWPDDTTEERQVFAEVRSVSVELNTPELGCSEDAMYRGLDGGPLEPFTGAVDTSAYCPIITSQVDTFGSLGG